MLVTLKSPPETRSQVKQLADLYDADVLDVGVDSMTLSLDDEPNRIDDFEELCRPYGIITVQRTGRVALPVLTKSVR
jgi:acetolactate synthase-1/3 small subunit